MDCADAEKGMTAAIRNRTILQSRKWRNLATTEAWGLDTPVAVKSQSPWVGFLDKMKTPKKWYFCKSIVGCWVR